MNPEKRPVQGRVAMTAIACLLALSPAGRAEAQSPSFSSARVLKVRTVVSVDRVHPGSSFQVAVVATVDQGWHINAHVPTFDYLIPTEATLEPRDGLAPGEPVYPGAEEKAFAFTDGEKLRVYEGEVLVGVDVAAAAALTPGPIVWKGVFSAQACNDTSCLAPGKVPFEVPVTIASPGDEVHLQERDLFARISFNRAAIPPAGPSEPPENPIAEAIRRQGFVFALGLIYLGGLALNLTPCVYPLIPITVSYFAGQSSGRLARSLALSGLYVLGMSLTYSALGAAAALTGGLLGAALQNPVVLLFVAAVMVALALSLFGLYEIQLPSFLTSRVRSRQGGAGAMFMGLTVGFVAAPCIGPFVVGLLAYVGQAGDPALGFLLFFVLSLGLGTPFLLLGAFSGAIAALPRAGAWMVWVRKLFGCVLIGMALHFLAPLLPETASRLALGLVVAGSGIFLGFLERSENRTALFRAVRAATGIAAVAAAAWVLVPGGDSAQALPFSPYGEGALEQAHAAGRPVIIDFTAEWCLACHELEALTFSDASVVAEGGRFTLLRADMTSFTSPPIEAIKKRFGILGLPWVVFLDSRGQERAELRVTGFVGAGEFLRRMREIS